MDLQTKKSKGLFKDLVSQNQRFWMEKLPNQPDQVEYESSVFIRKNKRLLGEFRLGWIGFSYPNLYLNKKKSSKKVRVINLQNTYCNLSIDVVTKSKCPFKLTLRHGVYTQEFFFQEKTDMDQWIAKLRGVCIMSDFYSMYHMRDCLVKKNFYKAGWVKDKQTQETYLIKAFHLREEITNKEDLQEQIAKQVAFNEIKALREIDHPNIIKLREVHEIKGTAIVVMEFINGSSLLKYIVSKGKLSEKDSSFIIETILKALQALHNKNVLHRNLKPENILLNYTSNGTELKLSDFGFSCTLNDNDESAWHSSENICSKCGTPGYMAPELLSNKTSTKAADVFSMGVILYTCLTGDALFKGRDAEDIIYKNIVASINKVSLKWASLTKNAQDLISKMTEKDPFKRISIEDCLNHPFFTSSARPERSYFGQNQLTLFYEDNENNQFNRAFSIEESLYRRQQSTKPRLDEILQSLIVPPSYIDFAKNGVSEIPEFYIVNSENLVESEIGGISEVEEGIKEVRKNIKIELLKGSLSQFDQLQTTPRFNKLSPERSMIKIPEPDEAPEEVILEADETPYSRDYQKCYTFPSIHNSPFVNHFHSLKPSQSYIFVSDDALSAGLTTSRQLPSVRDPLRRMLTNKTQILKKLENNNRTIF